MKHLLLLSAVISCAFAQSFSADISVYDDPTIYGVMTGHLNYDYANQKYRVDWRIGGSTVVEFIDYAAKLRYLYCTSCQTETWTTAQPLFSNSGATNTGQTQSINGVTCTKFNVANNPVIAVWMNGATICQADLATGAHVVFSNVAAVQNVFSNAGWNCPKQTCNKMIDFVLVFDESGSIVASDFAKERSFAQQFAGAYTFGTQDTGMALVQFSDSARLTISLTFIQASFVNALSVVYQKGGNTCIGCGIQTAQNHLNSAGRRVTSVLVVLTDGQNNVNTNQFTNIVNTAKNAGIILFALGVGNGVNANELTAISSTIPGVTTAYTNIPSFSALSGILDSLVQATCINIPGNPCGAGCHGFCSCGATCVCPSACDTRDKCKMGTCTPGQNGNGCSYTATVCNDGNYCTDDYCVPAEGCKTDRPTVCTASNNCQVPTCNPASGCAFPIRSCEDYNPCTDDTCHPGAANNGCDHPAIACDRCFNITCPAINCMDNKCDNTKGACVATPKSCDDGNACTTDTCDAATGLCVNTRKTCNDGDFCTFDLCDIQTGCYNPRFNASDCDDHSNCTRDSCNPQIGCVYENVTCVDGLACTADTCDSVLGCQFPPLDCLSIPRIKTLIGTCYQALCNESRHGCYLEPLPGAVIDNCGVCNGDNACAVVQLPSTVPYVVAGGLLAVVIIGAIIAGIAIISFAGKKGYDIWLAHKGGMSGAANNPLYNDGGLTGVNPTYTA